MGEFKRKLCVFRLHHLFRGLYSNLFDDVCFVFSAGNSSKYTIHSSTQLREFDWNRAFSIYSILFYSVYCFKGEQIFDFKNSLHSFELFLGDSAPLWLVILFDWGQPRKLFSGVESSNAQCNQLQYKHVCLCVCHSIRADFFCQYQVIALCIN